MLTLLFILFGLFLSVIGFEYGDGWANSSGQLVGWLGTLISTLSALRQYRENTPFQFIFSEDTWRSVDSGFQLELPTKRHSKGSAATAVVFQSTPSGHEEVMCEVSVTDSGTVLISASSRFTGKAVIK